MITTRPFTTTSGDYLSVLLSLWLPRYGWLLLIPILICTTVGILYDERFLLIALMLIFIVAPMLMSFLYTYYMLTPEARRAVIRKQIKIDENKSLHLIYLTEEKSDEEPEAKTASRRDLLPIATEEQRRPLPSLPLPEPEIIPWSDIIAVKSTSRFRVYLLKGQRLTFLLIPWEALRRTSAESAYPSD